MVKKQKENKIDNMSHNTIKATFKTLQNKKKFLTHFSKVEKS